MPGQWSSIYPYSIPLDEIGYHRQDDANSCGAAVAQMILHQQAVSGKPTALKYQQSQLYSKISSQQTLDDSFDWASAPDALVNALNACKGNYRGNFELRACRSETEATRELVWNIESRRTAGIALVKEYSHWVIVRGFGTNRQPLGPDDDFTVYWLEIFDPGPPLPHPKTHRWRDSCARGARGIRTLLYDTWRHEYMVPVLNKATGSSCWPCLYLVILDTPDIHKSSPVSCGPDDNCAVENYTLQWRGRIARILDGPLKQDKDVKTRLAKIRGNKSLTPDRAASIALEDLDQFVVASRGRWRELAELKTVGTIHQVKRIDRDGSYYIIALRYNGWEPVAMLVDAELSTVQEVVTGSELDSNALALRSEQDALKAIRKNKVSSGESLTLVWRPCVETFSPFDPLYEFRASPRAKPIYIRARDCKVFRNGLTILKHGA